MNKIDTYRLALRQLEDWDAYLLANSNLPGPRANLELLQAAILEGDASIFERYLALRTQQILGNSPEVFLVVVGVAGLGKLLASGDTRWLPPLRQAASDPRWRVREAVAIGLQTWGDTALPDLLTEMRLWVQGNPYEQRAVVAGLCEPRLLREETAARQVLEILDAITASILSQPDRKSEAFDALRKGLGYGWSVAIVALPPVGKPLFEKWSASPDRDIAWIVRENLKKSRLERMDAAWVEKLNREKLTKIER